MHVCDQQMFLQVTRGAYWIQRLFLHKRPGVAQSTSDVAVSLTQMTYVSILWQILCLNY